MPAGLSEAAARSHELWLEQYLTPTLNVVLRRHWSRRLQDTRALAWLVRTAWRGALPPAPFARAHVVIVRRSALGPLPDQDGLVGGAKALIDVLQPMEPKRRPYGLGIIAGDDQARITLEVRAERVPKAAVGTLVTVTPLIGAP